MHTPPEQTCPAAHLVPHMPQLFGSVSGLEHVPLHSSSPVEHPVTHVCAVAEHIGEFAGQLLPQ
jgi:hypothetical protein